VARFGRQPDLLPYTVRLLVDEQGVWARTSRGGLLVHLCHVRDARKEAIAATRELFSHIHEVDRLSRQLV